MKKRAKKVNKDPTKPVKTYTLCPVFRAIAAHVDECPECEDPELTETNLEDLMEKHCVSNKSRPRDRRKIKAALALLFPEPAQLAKNAKNNIITEEKWKEYEEGVRKVYERLKFHGYNKQKTLEWICQIPGLKKEKMEQDLLAYRSPKGSTRKTTWDEVKKKEVKIESIDDVSDEYCWFP